MLHERRSKIIQMISTDRMVKVSELCELFNVSIETIRRDLEYLEKNGYLSRVYGGAIIKSAYGLEPEYSSREVKHLPEKTAIGERAAELIKDGDTIAIDVGTTTLEFAKALSEKKGITVLTNAIPVAIALSDNKDIRVIMLGGDVRGGECSTSGFLAEKSMDMFNVDKAIIGIGGITADEGITDYHIEEANLRRHIIDRAENVIGLADFSKFGVIAMNRICGVERVTTIVTDNKASQKIVSDIRNKGVNIIIADINNK
ncbi:DeoR/GlpR family DNA-binding transcription regulator [Clostridium sp. HMP27]|uniref:DeoR/GlpR family DNA-binding transcription regulator n=1 Tax=Clostridium sp. HMP27 TaxID=1487921 RepID=UPI000691D1B9|nr:DeoR/GlpR family DNA-binding transcription regulator [Clostridium sp. HMP27]